MGDLLDITASLIAILQATSVAVGYFQGVRYAGVRYAAKDIRNFKGEFESLENMLASLCNYASANSRSKTLLQRLDTHLGGFLDDITELHAKLAKGFLRRRILLRWPLKDKECREYWDKIERLKIDILLAMDHDRKAQSDTIDTLKIQEYSTLQQDENRTRILSWLNPTDYDKRHREISARRQINTGEWLLRERVVVGWTEGNPAFQLIWGYGIPGAGKTFLISRMIDHLRDRSKVANWGVAFIYFNHSEQHEQTAIFFLSSLVKQFTYQTIHLPEEVSELYEQLQREQIRPTFEQLYSLLIAVTKPSKFTQAFIICDALDECDQDFQRRELLPLFDQMRKDGIRLFLTSREYPNDIQHTLQFAVKVKLSAQDEDIRVYIEQKIADNPRAWSLIKQTGCKERLITELQTCANGMFLLIHFHIRYLCEQTTPRQLLAALETLKDTSGWEGPMDPTCNRAMETIQSQPKRIVELAVNILTWLAKSQRVLTFHELQQAASVEQHHTEFDDLALPSAETILDVCANLVTIDQETDTVRLVHYTVQEYLVNNTIISENADFRLAMTCATFLSYNDFSEGPCKTRAMQDARSRLYPFMDYAGNHFASHLQQCDEALSFELVYRFLKSTQNVLSYLQAAEKSSYFQYHLGLRESLDGDPSLTLAAHLGHTSVMRSLLKERKDDSDWDMKEWIQLALNIAITRGFNSMIEVLLENGAEIECQTLCDVTLQDRLSVEKAQDPPGFKIGQEDMTFLKELPAAEEAQENPWPKAEEKDTNITAEDSSVCTPLHRAAQVEHEELAPLLPEKVTEPIQVTGSPVTEPIQATEPVQIKDSYKLQTIFDGDDVIHTTYKPDPIGSERKIEVRKRWTWKRNIGEGTFGVVYLEEDEGGNRRAVKTLARAGKRVDYSRELSILAKVADRQDLFVEFLGWYENRSSVFIAMEYMQYGDLSNYLSYPGLKRDVKELTRQILKGLVVLHERRICHRDLKPQNVLVVSIEPIQIKISDFGLSKDEKNTYLRTTCGTFGYLAPEVIDYLPGSFQRRKKYTNAVDIWALGCLLHKILTSETPFLQAIPDTDLIESMSGVVHQLPEREMDFGLLMDFCKGNMDLPTDLLSKFGVDDETVAFLKRLLVANPKSRISATEALESLWLLGKPDLGLQAQIVEQKGDNKASEV